MDVEVPIWLRRSSGWIVVFEASRALSDVAAYLIASELAGQAGNALSTALDKAHGDALATWLETAGGSLLGGRFYRTSAAGADLESISLRLARGTDSGLLEESLKNADGIGELLIETPHLESIDSKILCRIGRSGTIRVYASEITDGAIATVLLEFERAWESIPLSPRQRDVDHQ